MINQSTPIYDAYHVVFQQAMQREAKFIYDYWTGVEYKCLFRKQADTNQLDNSNSIIFYQTSTPIKDGDLLKFKDKIFLVLNREEIENDVYFKSSLLETSTIIEIFSNGKELKIPCYAYELLSTSPSNGGMISIVNGSIELLAPKNSYTDNLEIGASFKGMGGVYKIVNLYYKSNILHIFVQRELENPSITYTLKVNAESQYSNGSSHKLEAVAKRTEGTNEEVVSNADVKWSSSDSTICTVSNDGTIMCLKAGTVAISAFWVGKGITDTVTFNIVADAPKVCTISGVSEITHGIEEIFEASFFNNGGQPDTNIVPVWSLDLPSALKGHVTLQKQSGNTIEVLVADRESLIKQVFTLNLTDSTSEYSTSKSLKVTGYF